MHKKVLFVLENTTGGIHSSFGRRTHVWRSIVLGLILIFMFIQGVSAFGGAPHSDITVEALREFGINTRSAQQGYIVQNNLMADIIGTAEGSGGIPDVMVIPDVLPNPEEIEMLFSNKANFQNCNNYDDLDQEWIRLQEQTYRGVQEAKTDPLGPTKFLVLMGLSLHTVQDFYAHSTWTEYSVKNDWGDSTWFDINDTIKRAATPISDPWVWKSTDHENLNKDWNWNPNYPRSYRQAYYASCQWIQLMKDWAGPDLWDAAMTPVPDQSNWGANMNNDFLNFFWYSGTWDHPFSKSLVDNLNYCTIQGYPTPLNLMLGTRIYDGELCEAYIRAQQVGVPLYSPVEGEITYNKSGVSISPTPPPKRWMFFYTEHLENRNDDIVGIDPLGNDADFYPVLRVPGHQYVHAPIPDTNNVYDKGVPWFWDTYIPINPYQTTVWYDYAIWDDDLSEIVNPGSWPTLIVPNGDDHCDVWDGAGRDFIDTVSTSSGLTWPESEGDDNDNDEVWLRHGYEFIPRYEESPWSWGYAQIDIYHPGLRKNLTVSIGVVGEDPKVIWDQNTTVNETEQATRLVLAQPLPWDLLEHWKPSDVEPWYVEVTNHDTLPNDIASVNKFHLYRVGADPSEVFVPPFKVLPGETKRIYIPAGNTGAVTILAAGDQSYSHGEEVKFIGTNTASNTVYLFITGLGLPWSGGNLIDPRTQVTNGQPTSFTHTEVRLDHTWEYKWQTKQLNIPPGEYTVFAVSTPNDYNHLGGTQYAALSITIEKPFVVATVSKNAVSQGDNLFITGVAEGNPSPGIAIWILGAEKTLYEIVHPLPDSSFSYELTTETIQNLEIGRYSVIVQHPMNDDIFNVFPGEGTDEGYVDGSFPTNPSRLFKIEGTGALPGLDVLEELSRSINDPASDDTYTNLQFRVVGPPWSSQGGHTLSSVAMDTKSSTGEWFAIIRGTDNHIYFNKFTQPTNSWAGWTSIGGTTYDEPTVAYTDNNYVHVVIRGTDNVLYYKKLNLSTNVWDNSWTNLGGHTSSTPTLLSWSSAQIPGDPAALPSVWLAIRGTDNHVYFKECDPDTGWDSTWQSCGGTTYDRPSLAFRYSLSPGGSIVTLGIRGTDNKVYTRDYSVGSQGTGLKGPWTSPGGSTLSPPVIRYKNDILHIVVRGIDNHTYYKAGSSRYTSIGGTTYDMPAVYSWPDQHYFEVSVRGTDSKIYDKKLNTDTNQWTGWTDMKNTAKGHPTFSRGMWTDGVLAIRGPDNGVYFHVMYL